jgi:hypothetical protein
MKTPIKNCCIGDRSRLEIKLLPMVNEIKALVKKN